MPSIFRKIGRVFLIQWSETIQYRGDILLWTLAEAMTPLVSLAIWYKVASSSHTAFTPQDALTYYIIIMFIRSFSNAWNGYTLAEQIQKGEIVRYLVRPLSVLWVHVAENITIKIVRLALPLLILAGLLIFYSHLFSPSIFVPGHIALFVISLILASILSFTTDIFFGLLAFWIEEAIQIRFIKDIFMEAASGVLIPFALMPAAARQILSLLPFRYIISAPAELLLGQAANADAGNLFAAQITWLAVTVVAVVYLWRRGLKVYAVPGQ